MGTKKGSGFGKFLVFMILLAGAAVAGLHFTGKLDSVIERAKKLIAKEESEKPAAPDKPEAVVKEKPDKVVPIEVASVNKPVIKKKPAQVKAMEKNRDTALAAAYRKKFKAPRPGSKIVLVLKSKKKINGVLDEFDDAGVMIKRDKFSVMINRSELAPVSLARFYPDEYVKYCVAVHKYREYVAQTRAEAEKQRQAAYAQNGTGSKLSKPLPPPPLPSAIQNLDMKEWMEQHGESDLLKQRKARVNQHEKQRQAAGSEY